MPDKNHIKYSRKHSAESIFVLPAEYFFYIFPFLRDLLCYAFRFTVKYI